MDAASTHFLTEVPMVECAQKARRWRYALPALVLALVAVLAGSIRDQAASVPESAPASSVLDADSRAVIARQLQAARYAVTADARSPNRYTADNPSQGLALGFDSDGLDVISGADNFRLDTLSLDGQMPDAARLHVNGPRLERQHPGYVEWYENRPEGLEQGWTLQQPGMRRGERRIELAVRGARIESAGPDSLSFVAEASGARYRYAGLRAWDAQGRAVPAQLRATGNGRAEVVVDDRDASYPLTIDPALSSVQDAKLLASDAATGNLFGWSVAVDGDTAVVGADGNSSSRGAAYVFARNQGGANTWGQVVKLTASDGVSGDYFGSRVALSGDTLVVSALGSGSSKGAAYVFLRNQGGANTWGQVAKLLASDGASGDQFGIGLAVAGDTVLVGANGNSNSKGAAYVFQRDQGGANLWGQVAKLVTSSPVAGDNFGYSVALQGDTALIGAIGVSGSNTGAAFIYSRNQNGANTWGQVAKLAASDSQAQANFGYSVALDGDTAVVGAQGKSAVYLYQRDQPTVSAWGQVAKLVPSNAADTGFGSVVAISGDLVAAGAALASSGSAGAVYVYARNHGGAGIWAQIARLAGSDTTSGDLYGSSVALDGDTVLAGAPGKSSSTGAAYVYTYSNGAWQLQAQPVPSSVGTGYYFGPAVVYGDTALMTAPGDNGGTGVGYLFARNQGGVNNGWAQQARMIATDGASGDAFGSALAIDGDLALIGARYKNSDTGAAYFFSRNQGGADTWGQLVKLTASDAAAADQFGVSVSVSGDIAVVGAYAKNNTTGAAYVYERNQGGANAWGQVVKLVASDPVAGDGFGFSVAVDGDIIVIGARYKSNSTGAAYVFSRNQGGANHWGQLTKLTASDAARNDQFGVSTAVNGDIVVVGAVGKSGVTGAAYVYSRNQGGANTWGQLVKLTASDAAAGDSFGAFVSVNGDTIVSSAPGKASTAGGQADGTGATYLFSRNQNGNNAWGQILKLLAPVPAPSAGYGTYVSVYGETLVIGSPGQNSNTGTAYVYSLATLLPALSQDQTSLNFGTVLVSSTSAAQTVTISNTGTADTSLSAPAVSGTNAGDFSASGCTGTLTAGTSCSLSISFSPTVSGARSAVVSLTSSAPTSPTTVSLSGTGQYPPGSLGFASTTASVNEGSASSVTLTVNRSGGSGGAASVNYQSSDGTAVSPGDYAAVSGTLNWTDGDAAAKTIQITIPDNQTYKNPEQFTVTLSSASGATLGSATTATVTINDNDADTTPDAFAFQSVTSANPSTLEISNAITVTGINTATPISVSGGSYSINNGAYTSTAGTVNLGDKVTVQQIASSSYSATTTTTLNIGGVAGGFSVTTRAADTTPDAFSFTPVGNVPPGAGVTSNTITVSGIEAASPISISGDASAQFCINGSCLSGLGYVVNAGDQVAVKLTASASVSTTVSATLTIGGVSATYSVTSQDFDSTPDPFSFAAVTGVDPSSLQTSNTITVTGVVGFAPISISGGSYSVNNGSYTSASGTVNASDQVTVQQTASGAYSTTTTATLNIGGVTGGFSVTTRAADVQPNAFSFAPVNGVAPNTLVPSNSIQVSGIEAPISVSVAGGSYSINNGNFTTVAGTTVAGDTIRVQQTAASTYSTSTRATLTLGSGGNAQSAGFVVTTAAPDTTPDAFGFGSVSNVAPGSTQTSGSVPITGIDSTSPVSVSGGSYSINGSSFTTAAGTISPGSNVVLQGVASSAFSTSTQVVLTVGGVQGTYTITTKAPDTTPDAFSFNAVTNVPLSSVQTSNTVKITGIDAPSPISVTGGSYSLNSDAYTSAAGTVNSGDTVSLQQTASSSFSTTTTATLSIGGVSAGFAATTLAADGTPNNFSFGSVSDVAPGSTQTSGAVVLSGINTGTAVSVSGGSYSINNAPYTSASGTINPGDSVSVRGVASSNYSTSTQVVLTAGGVQGIFTITTAAADTVPDAFSFTSISAVNPGSLQTSNTITVSGINAPSPVTIAGGSYSINGGAYGSTSGSVNAGDTLTLQQTASSNYSTTTTAALNIGGTSAGFSVTTRVPNTVPQSFTFAPVGNAALSTLVVSNTVSISGIEAPTSVSVSGDSGAAYSVNGGSYTSSSGQVSPGDSVMVQVRSSSAFSATTQATLNVGGVSSSFAVTTLAADTTPDAFGFASVTNAAPGSVLSSNAVPITGINTATPISVTGGAYSINGNSYTSAIGTVNAGDTVSLQQTASSSYSTTTVATLTVGNVSGAYSVTTRAPDTTPDAFTFAPITGAVFGSVQKSNTIIVSGIEAPTAVSLSGDASAQVCINGANCVSGLGYIVNPGDSVYLQLTASFSPSTTVSAVLTLGGISSEFDVATAAGDSTPDAFSFASNSNVPLGSTQTSSAITVSGINVPVPISVSGGSYSVNGSAYTTAAGSVVAGDSVTLRQTASGSYSTATTATLTIGGLSAGYTVTTASAPATPPPATSSGGGGGGGAMDGTLLALLFAAGLGRRRAALRTRLRTRPRR